MNASQPGTGTLFSAEKRSLILAGGGVRLAYHAGVLLALEESGLTFNHVDGTSGGIFCTAMLASGQLPAQIASRWRTLNVNDFMSLMPLQNYLRPGRMSAFGDADGIRNKVFPHLGIEVARINQNQQFTATFNVCNFSRKTLEAVPHDRVLTEHLIAGVSLPIFMPALRIGEEWYTDGVWIKDANLMEAVRRGAEEIWLVWCIGNTPEYKEGSFIQYVHMIEMSANGSLLEELNQIAELNTRIERGDSPWGQGKPIVIHVIKPPWPLPLDPDLFLGKIDTRTLINMGYRDAHACMKITQSAGVALDHKASLMTEPPENLNFRMAFQGTGKNELAGLALDLFIFIRAFQDGVTMEPVWYGSLKLGADGPEVPFSATQISITEGGQKAYALKAEFKWNGREMEFRAVLPMATQWEFWMGLEFKRLISEIAEKGRMTHKPEHEIEFNQPFWSRFNKLRTMSSSKPEGFFSRIWKKLFLSSKLYR